MTIRLYTKTTPLLEDRKDPNWRSAPTAAEGAPISWMDWSGDRLKLNAQPFSGYVLVGYIERPTVMVNDGDTPDVRIPDYYHPILKYAAASYLLQLAGTAQDIKKASDLYAKFLYLCAQGEGAVASVEVDK